MTPADEKLAEEVISHVKGKLTLQAIFEDIQERRKWNTHPPYLRFVTPTEWTGLLEDPDFTRFWNIQSARFKVDEERGLFQKGLKYLCTIAEMHLVMA